MEHTPTCSTVIDARCPGCKAYDAAPFLLATLEQAVKYLPANDPALHDFWKRWIPMARTAIKQARNA